MTDQQERAALKAAADRILFAETDAEAEAACADALALIDDLTPLQRQPSRRASFAPRRVRRGRGSY